ncbi:hypothetical protein PoB_004868400 [Plakobranchus ocellatus]|uniref:Uncharacterized protein n=1 Tax=Plakobranchus ocellatus TaxID=259542 RepID=A0AAV4BTN4_9GAST|nr:hypothetical protein PoB_004868400 [Plakobranchus ocellatus]
MELHVIAPNREHTCPSTFIDRVCMKTDHHLLPICKSSMCIKTSCGFSKQDYREHAPRSDLQSYFEGGSAALITNPDGEFPNTMSGMVIDSNHLSCRDNQSDISLKDNSFYHCLISSDDYVQKQAIEEDPKCSQFPHSYLKCPTFMWFVGLLEGHGAHLGTSTVWHNRACNTLVDRLFPACASLSTSLVKKLLVYLLVLTILFQSCCEAGVLLRDRPELELRGAQRLSKKDNAFFPYVHLSRKRRSAQSSGIPAGNPSSSDASSEKSQSDKGASTPISPALIPPLSNPAPASSAPSSPQSSSPSSSPSSPDIPRPAISSTQHTSPEFTIPEDLDQTKLLAMLVSTLEKLSLLQQGNSSTPRCFRLREVVQTPSLPAVDSKSSPSLSDQSTANQRGNEVSLLVQEVSSYTQEIDFNATSSKNNSINGNSKSNSRGNATSQTQLLDTTICFKDSMVPVILGKEMKIIEQSKTPDDARNASVVGNAHKDENTQNGGGLLNIIHSGKLSRTQIVVISTCSAIIGMFFLIAAFLRIRNYIKRIRLEQAQARRPKFRSCSVALRNPTHSMEQLRRDSLASKASHQNSVTTKGSNYSQTNASSREEDSSASSPRHDPDTTPLLVITRAPPNTAAEGANPNSIAGGGAESQPLRGGANGGPQGSAAYPGAIRYNRDDTPTQSNSSLQYIDEDRPVVRKKVPLTSSLVKNASGEGGGYTICMNNRAAPRNGGSSHTDRPGTLPTGRDAMRAGTSGKVARSRGDTPPSMADNSGVGRDSSPTALLSPATSSVDGSVNPSFSSGSISNSIPKHREIGGSETITNPSHPATGACTPEHENKSSAPNIIHARDDVEPQENARASGESRTKPGVKTRMDGYQPVSTEEDNAPQLSPELYYEQNDASVQASLASDASPPNTVDASDMGRESPRNKSHNGSINSTQIEAPSPEEMNNDEKLQPLYLSKGAPPSNEGNDIEIPLLKQQSGFGLTQSDTSVSSAPNQGKEFSGQMEYSPSSGYSCDALEIADNDSDEYQKQFHDQMLNGVEVEDGVCSPHSSQFSVEIPKEEKGITGGYSATPDVQIDGPKDTNHESSLSSSPDLTKTIPFSGASEDCTPSAPKEADKSPSADISGNAGDQPSQLEKVSNAQHAHKQSDNSGNTADNVSTPDTKCVDSHISDKLDTLNSDKQDIPLVVDEEETSSKTSTPESPDTAVLPEQSLSSNVQMSSLQNGDDQENITNQQKTASHADFSNPIDISEQSPEKPSPLKTKSQSSNNKEISLLPVLENNNETNKDMFSASSSAGKDSLEEKNISNHGLKNGKSECLSESLSNDTTNCPNGEVE